jgi:hypothetical protein
MKRGAGGDWKRMMLTKRIDPVFLEIVEHVDG